MLITLLWVSVVSAFSLTNATCDPQELQQLRPSEISEIVEGETKLLTDPRDFDSQVSVGLEAMPRELRVLIPGYPPFDIRYKDIEIPLLTYYDRCLDLTTTTEDHAVMCFDCKAHRDLWMATIMEHCFQLHLRVPGALPIWPRANALPINNATIKNAIAPAANNKTKAPPLPKPAPKKKLDQNLYVHILAPHGSTPDITIGKLDLGKYLKEAVKISKANSTTTTTTTTQAPRFNLTAPTLSPLAAAEKAHQARVEEAVDLMDAMNERAENGASEAEQPELDLDMNLAVEAAHALLV